MYVCVYDDRRVFTPRHIYLYCPPLRLFPHPELADGHRRRRRMHTVKIFPDIIVLFAVLPPSSEEWRDIRLFITPLVYTVNRTKHAKSHVPHKKGARTPTPTSFTYMRTAEGRKLAHPLARKKKTMHVLRGS